MRKIIIADPDLNYALKLQLRFFQKMHGAYEIDIFTEKQFVKELLKYSGETDSLLINETMMTDEIDKANIKNLFILTEGNPSNASEISRYSDIDEIYNKVRNSVGSTTRSLTKSQDSTVILFKSSSGGTGKTVLAMALAEHFAKKFYKVLYINTQTFQTFQYYLKDKTTIPNGDAMTLQHEKDIYLKLKGQIKNDTFNYLSPFTMPLYAYNISNDILSDLIAKAKESKNYDYIIVDSDNNINLATIKQIAIADKIVLVSLPKSANVYTNSEFFQKINLKQEKVVRICNMATDGMQMEEADEYVSEWQEELNQETIHDFAASSDIYKLAVLVS